MARVVSVLASDPIASQSSVSFLNLQSLPIAIGYSDEVVFAPDGWLMSVILSLITMRVIPRMSFDMTSLAPLVFSKCAMNQDAIFVFGGKLCETEVFVDKIKKLYPCMTIAGLQDGYIKEDEWEGLIQKIIDSEAKVVIVGLGAGKQEAFTVALTKKGFKGKVYTCGGFISQTASSTDLSYYPKIIDRLHLRALYRFCKESHTRKRYLLEYPINFSSLLFNVARRKILFRVI